VLHEAGDIEESFIELLPVRSGPVEGSEAPEGTEAQAGTFFEFSQAQGAVLMEVDDAVVVITEELEAGQAAEVEA
jgi:hypothetical protein